jgi:hypothetical protein
MTPHVPSPKGGASAFPTPTRKLQRDSTGFVLGWEVQVGDCPPVENVVVCCAYTTHMLCLVKSQAETKCPAVMGE